MANAARGDSPASPTRTPTPVLLNGSAALVAHSARYTA